MRRTEKNNRKIHTKMALHEMHCYMHLTLMKCTPDTVYSEIYFHKCNMCISMFVSDSFLYKYYNIIRDRCVY